MNVNDSTQTTTHCNITIALSMGNKTTILTSVIHVAFDDYDNEIRSFNIMNSVRRKYDACLLLVLIGKVER